ncbi:MAG: sensor histidine kinase [Hamadaea sp.]|nr:sensor histidine kinase [Hamadaea sp.]
MPFAIGGLVIAAVLLGNAALVPEAGNVGVVEVALALLTAGAVAVCRKYPVPAMAVVTVAMLAFHVRVHAGVSASFAVLGTVYVAGWLGHRISAAVASVVFLTGFLAYDISTSSGGLPQQVGERTSLLLGWFVAANIAGLIARQRQAYLAQVEQRALEAERTREEMALRRAGEERLRIARELHDSLTHSISVIKVQAGIAVHLARKHGEEPPPALLAIQEASADAMRELRATLGVLRTSDMDSAGLDRLPELLERTRSLGVPVTVEISGEPRSLPAEVDQAAYRVVQEGLTNVAKHAGSAAASVAVAYQPAAVVISVTDDGPVSDRPVTPGVGLRGMRERVTGLGGTLSAGPVDSGGFAVRACLPLPLPPASAVPASVAPAAVPVDHGVNRGVDGVPRQETP